jgi:dienelactone hydrolase
MNRVPTSSSSQELALTRRSLVGKSLAAGGTLASLGLSRANSAVAAGAPTSPTASSATTYFEDATMNFEVLFALGSAGYGISEVGEVLTTIDDINAQGPSYQSFYDQFLALGRRLANEAAQAERRGRKVTARSKFLRSAEYFSQALYFVLGTDRPTRARERAVYRVMQYSWNRATHLFSPPFERVKVPYGRTLLPGYLLRPDSSQRPRPTVILNNGSDAQNVDLYAFGGAAAIERGYNALIFEGPGQGSLLFERNMPFVPDWERVVRAVVNMLVGRPDVDRGRIAIVGWSFCGGSVARAAAYDRRLAAVALDPGVNDVLAAYHVGDLQALANAGQKQRVNDAWANRLAQFSPAQRFTVAKRSEIYAQPTFYDQVRYAEKFNLGAATIGRIKAPTLVMEAQDEQFYPGQSRAVYSQLRSPKKLVTFTVSEGAEYHDEPMAPQTRNEVLFDWLDRTLGV